MKYTTPVPNVVFDRHLPTLTESELKILLIIIRQTYGWADKRTGGRKTRDRITHSQFVMKTGLSRRVISKAINNLVLKELISITDYQGTHLHTTLNRKGKSFLLYAPRFEPPKPKVSIYQGKQVGAVLGQRYWRFVGDM